MNSSRIRKFTLTLAVILLLATYATAGRRETTLHRFQATPGAYPGGLVSDSSGNFFGVTVFGGFPCPGGDGCGTVFEFSPIKGGGDGATRPSISFNGGAEGYAPSGNLVFDNMGNLYGTNSGGGQFSRGTVFELSFGGESWTETTLYSFGGYSGDAISPFYGLIFDGHANFYGTTTQGGAEDLGAVYELSPTGTGTWIETVVYSFDDVQEEAHPYGLLALDASGSLYGTTLSSVFELSPVGDGTWNEQMLYFFGSKSHGLQPLAGVVFGSDGNLYGTTSAGGIENAGTVFELGLNSGSWTEEVLHQFRPSRGDGGFPTAPVSFDTSGNLYGTTSGGDSSQYGHGTVFQLKSNSGIWTETARYSFSGGKDGSSPATGLLFDTSGDLYGTTPSGGAILGVGGYGVIFQITP